MFSSLPQPLLVSSIQSFPSLLAILLFFQVDSTFLFITKSSDRLQLALLFGEIREMFDCVLADP